MALAGFQQDAGGTLPVLRTSATHPEPDAVLAAKIHVAILALEQLFVHRLLHDRLIAFVNQGEKLGLVRRLVRRCQEPRRLRVQMKAALAIMPKAQAGRFGSR